MPRKPLPTKSVAFRLPQDICDRLDEFVDTDPTLTKTEAVSVALHAFMTEFPSERTRRIAEFRVRLYPTK